jgi:hypothetical protein
LVSSQEYILILSGLRLNYFAHPREVSPAPT